MSQFHVSASSSQRKTYKRARSEKIEVTCAQCQHIQEIPAHVNSWNCTQCGHRLEFGERILRGGEQGRIQTYGGVVLPHKTVYAGTHIQAAWARVSGISLGSIALAESLTVDGPAQLKNWVKARQIEIIRSGALMALSHPIECAEARIEGKVKARSWIVQGRLEILTGAHVEIERLVFHELCVEKGAILRVKRARSWHAKYESEVLRSHLKIEDDGAISKQQRSTSPECIGIHDGRSASCNNESAPSDSF